MIFRTTLLLPPGDNPIAVNKYYYYYLLLLYEHVIYKLYQIDMGADIAHSVQRLGCELKVWSV